MTSPRSWRPHNLPFLKVPALEVGDVGATDDRVDLVRVGIDASHPLGRDMTAGLIRAAPAKEILREV